MKPGWVLVCLPLVGCSQIFGLDEPMRVVPGTPDGGSCGAASTECVNDDTLRTCSAAGAMAVDTACGWGCTSTGVARCLTLVPQGGMLEPEALDPDPAVGSTLINGAITINTTSGAIEGIRDAGEGVINGIRFTNSTRGGGVFTFGSLVVEETTVSVIGSQPLILVALDGATINGTLDLRGTCAANAAGPGGSTGGAASANGMGPGGGLAGSGDKRGASGAGHGTSGGGGGNGGAGGPTSGGPAYGDATITILRGGSGGGGGGGGGGFLGGFGGGGGGALQIASNRDIAIDGVINVGGCGGKGGTSVSSGGGGGSGGTILLEGAHVAIGGTLAANGGGGGAGDSGMPGESGRASRIVALGGASSNGSSGGDGGAGTVAPQPGGDATAAGGGGGAGGRVRINTRSGAASIALNAVMSPAFTDISGPATQGIAATR